MGDDAEYKATMEKKKAEAEAAKKANKVAKSIIFLEVKPWDDTTDLAEMEKMVRTIAMDGLLWGGSKLEEIGYGIKKLIITATVEDDKVGTDDLTEQIEAFEDHVQSVDIAGMQKV